MPQCQVEDCDNETRRKSAAYCEKHYYRLRRQGDVHKLGKRRDIPRNELWEQVRRAGEGECWLWTGRVEKTGYAQFAGDPAHRVAYELIKGPIPEGLTIDHLCFVPLCMNPDHLEAVTLAENVRRMNMLNRGRCRKGHLISGVVDVYVRPDNGRSMCRQCIRARSKGLVSHS